MRGMNYEHLDRNDLLNYVKNLMNRCQDLEQMNENNQKIIQAQSEKINDYQKKITDIGSTLRMLY